MNPTRNDLPKKTRAAVCTLLQRQLAAAIDLSLQAKQAHWNVKGPQFIALHELFDKVYEEASGHVDELAERIVQLGGIADGTLAAVRRLSKLPDYPVDAHSGPEHVEALSNSLAAYGKAIRAAIDEADAAGDADSADLLTGISRGCDKQLWFVESHLQ